MLRLLLLLLILLSGIITGCNAFNILFSSARVRGGSARLLRTRDAADSLYTAVPAVIGNGYFGKRLFSILAGWAGEDDSGLDDGSVRDYEIVEVTEEHAREEWLARGLNEKDFTVEGMIKLWEEDDGTADDDDLDAAALAAMMDSVPFYSSGTEADEDQAQSEVSRGLAEATNSLEEAAITELPVEDFLDGAYAGIDLGTTNSAIAIMEAGVPVIIPNQQGSPTTPSIVGYVEDDEGKGPQVIVGEPARRQYVANPTNTYASFKRLIGRTKEQAREAGVKLAPLGVDKQYESLIRLKSGLKLTLTPEDVSAEVIKQLIADAELYLNKGKEAGEKLTRVRRAVVTVPAYFDDEQCKATEKAAEMAGLLKVKLMREPQAAALAYGLAKKDDELILVFDLGGGTFDVSILEVGGGVVEVVATCGDAFLGGDDFDYRIVQALAQDFVMTGGQDPRNDPLKVKRLKDAAEELRIRLSSEREVPVILPFLDGMKGLEMTMTRKRMEHIIREDLKRLLRPVREVALLSGVTLPGETGAFLELARGVDDDALTDDPSGFSEAQLKRFRRQQGRQKGQAKKRKAAERAHTEAFKNVANNMGDERSKLRAFPSGSRMINQVVLVGGATKMPCVKRMVAAITGILPQHTVNPDEAVALGAAVYAAIVDGELDTMEVMSNWQAALLRGMAQAGMIY